MENYNRGDMALRRLANASQHPQFNPDGRINGFFAYMTEEAKREMIKIRKETRQKSAAAETVKTIADDVLARLCRDPVSENEKTRPLVACISLLLANMEAEKAKKRGRRCGKK